VDETIHPGEAPHAYVRRLAMEKSARAQELLRTSDVVILGADTAVVIDGEILGKPLDDLDAERMLRQLSGRRHDVMTGVSVRSGDNELNRVEVTAVYVRMLTDADLSWYVASGEGRDKAGSYAIQGLASRFVPRVEGSYSNVVGLPVESVFEMLRHVV
jgi:septum formation protein